MGRNRPCTPVPSSNLGSASAGTSKEPHLPCRSWQGGLLSTRETFLHSWASLASPATTSLPCPQITSQGQAKSPQAATWLWLQASSQGLEGTKVELLWGTTKGQPPWVPLLTSWHEDNNVL